MEYENPLGPAPVFRDDVSDRDVYEGPPGPPEVELVELNVLEYDDSSLLEFRPGVSTATYDLEAGGDCRLKDTSDY